MPSKFLLRCLVGFLGSFSHPEPSPSAPALLRLPRTPSSLPPAVQIHSHLLLPRPSPAVTQDPPLSDSTSMLSSLLALAVALSVSKLVLSLPVHITATAARIVPSSVELAEIRDLRGSLACAVGPLFFAALKDRPSRYLNTPLTVVASGMAKWLDIYSRVLMVRVLLSWFSNIPWDHRPVSAIRDLCDPYLNLFQNIISLVFDTLDVSPLAAVAMMSPSPPAKPDEFIPHPVKE